jgi:hypothetical protein
MAALSFHTLSRQVLLGCLPTVALDFFGVAIVPAFDTSDFFVEVDPDIPLRSPADH